MSLQSVCENLNRELLAWTVTTAETERRIACTVTHRLRLAVDPCTHDIEQHTPIHSQYGARILDEVPADDAVFTVDTGCDASSPSVWCWSGRSWPTRTFWSRP